MNIYSSNPIAFGDDGEAYPFVQLKRQVNLLGDQLSLDNGKQVLINCSSTYYFLVALLAALKAGKQAIILPNALEETRRHYASAYDLVLDDARIQAIATTESCAATLKDNDLSPLEISDNAEIVFYTSGSSGEPARIVKQLICLWREVTDTTRLSNIQEVSLVASTVPHHHMYGFLFKVLGPLFSQRPFYIPIVRFPNDMQGLNNFMLISSPAFLTRLDESDVIAGCKKIISSGGPLPVDAGQRVEAIFDAVGIEVYGSTETGGIAYRAFSAPKLFTPLPGVRTRKNSLGQLEILSRYMSEEDWYTCNDFVSFKSESTFELIGRSDDIVKIEEKRISLTHIQKMLTAQFRFIERAYVFTFETAKRRKLGALIVRRQAEASAFGSSEMSVETCIEDMTAFLRENLDPVFIPKKWKIVDRLDTNEMGKTSRASILAAVFGDTPETEEMSKGEVTNA
jgi:acyl-coenzyme A synthetase/AMP-(fatty) acid ligase